MYINFKSFTWLSPSSYCININGNQHDINAFKWHACTVCLYTLQLMTAILYLIMIQQLHCIIYSYSYVCMHTLLFYCISWILYVLQFNVRNVTVVELNLILQKQQKLNQYISVPGQLGVVLVVLEDRECTPADENGTMRQGQPSGARHPRSKRDPPWLLWNAIPDWE